MREALYEHDCGYSVRKMSGRIGIVSSCRSKIERVEQAPPSEKTITSFVEELILNSEFSSRFRSCCYGRKLHG